MTTVIAAVIALIGGIVQSRRHPDRPAAEVHFVWWMVWVVGIASILAAAVHVFDGPHTAEMIGYARGEGGFQWENAMGDLAIGVVGVMSYWYRGNFWLATLVVLTVQYVGDAAGHLYFWLAQGNTKPYNIGVPLIADIVLPIVMWVLYLAASRVSLTSLRQAPH
ncbi:MAG: DUF6790 family protein [Mycobacterium sp.]